MPASPPCATTPSQTNHSTTTPPLFTKHIYDAPNDKPSVSDQSQYHHTTWVYRAHLWRTKWRTIRIRPITVPPHHLSLRSTSMTHQMMDQPYQTNHSTTTPPVFTEHIYDAPNDEPSVSDQSQYHHTTCFYGAHLWRTKWWTIRTRSPRLTSFLSHTTLVYFVVMCPIQNPASIKAMRRPTQRSTITIHRDVCYLESWASRRPSRKAGLAGHPDGCCCKGCGRTDRLWCPSCWDQHQVKLFWCLLSNWHVVWRHSQLASMNAKNSNLFCSTDLVVSGLGWCPVLFLDASPGWTKKVWGVTPGMNTYVGLARAIYIYIYIWCVYGVSCRGFIKYMGIYGIHIGFWPTLNVCHMCVCVRMLCLHTCTPSSQHIHTAT